MGSRLIKCGSAIVPFLDVFPKHTQLYKLMTTKFFLPLFAKNNDQITTKIKGPGDHSPDRKSVV